MNTKLVHWREIKASHINVISFCEAVLESTRIKPTLYQMMKASIVIATSTIAHWYETLLSLSNVLIWCSFVKLRFWQRYDVAMYNRCFYHLIPNWFYSREVRKESRSFFNETQITRHASHRKISQSEHLALPNVTPHHNVVRTLVWQMNTKLVHWREIKASYINKQQSCINRQR